VVAGSCVGLAMVFLFLLFQYFLIAQHVLGETPLIIRSSKTVIAASGFTYFCGCRQLCWFSHGLFIFIISMFLKDRKSVV
jgi:hypothetical protein